MPCRLLLTIAGPENAGCSATIEVVEDYQRVLNLIVPTDQPRSALEARMNLSLTERESGCAVFVRPELIGTIQELGDDG